jgi:hypothetical protein
MKATLASSGIEIIDSEKLLGPLNGAVEFHVAHGHQHISELTHALIGAELGRRILNQADGRQLLVSHP